MCYWKKHRKYMEQKISPIVVWPLIPRKGGRGWERNAAPVDRQERFISKPVIKNTAQIPASTHCLWKANTDGAGDAWAGGGAWGSLCRAGQRSTAPAQIGSELLVERDKAGAWQMEVWALLLSLARCIRGARSWLLSPARRRVPAGTQRGPKHQPEQG